MTNARKGSERYYVGTKTEIMLIVSAGKIGMEQLVP